MPTTTEPTTADSTVPLIVEPEELAATLDRHTYRIIHISSAQVYNNGHVPGAVHLPPQALVKGQPPIPGKLPELAQLQRLFSYLGHTADTNYLVYDDEGGGWAGRLIWTLDAIGHAQYSYLNGGLNAWRMAGLPLEVTPNQPQPTEPRIRVHREPIAEIEDILPRLGDPTFAIWDARSPAEHRGEKVLAQKGGHIPGAINAEWTELMDLERGYRIRSDAEDFLQKKGLTADKDIVTHCQSHHRSGFTYLVGKALGFNIRGYHGSWAEWGNHPDTPVQK